jgi:hypothetical protein
MGGHISVDVISLGTFLILTALAAETTHGHGVIRAVAELPHGEVVLRLAFGGAR